MTTAARKINSTIDAMRALGYSTDDIRARLQSALDEAERFIAREEPRAAALRPAETQALLESYRQQRDALQAAIDRL